MRKIIVFLLFGLCIANVSAQNYPNRGQNTYPSRSVRNNSSSNYSSRDDTFFGGFKSEGICYYINDEAGKVVSVINDVQSMQRGTTSNNKYKGDVIIPDFVNHNGKKYKVVSIKNNAFKDSEITSVCIPNTIGTIGDEAFRGCKRLTSVTFSNGNTPSNGNTLIIRPYAFADCPKLSIVVLPESVESIGNNAFQNCTKLTSVTIPDEKVRIAKGAIPPNVTIKYSGRKMSSQEGVENENNLEFNGLYYKIDKESMTACLIKGYYQYSGDIRIPNTITLDGISYSVTQIGENACKGCSGINSIVIPNTVTTIGKFAFYGCSNINTLTIPNSVKTIGDRAFYYCKGLTSIVLPDSITEICEGVFYGCQKIDNVTIPDGVTKIGDRAFVSCSNLHSVIIPNSVTTIGDVAFVHCVSLESINIPNKNVKISRDAFPKNVRITYISNAEAENVNQNRVYKVIDKHGEITYFKLETTSAGENTVRIKCVSNKGEKLNYNGMEYTYWGKWQEGEKNGMNGLILIKDEEKSIRDLYMSFRGVVGEMHSMVFISYRGLIYSYHEDNPKLEVELINDFKKTSNEEIVQENKYRQEVVQQYNRTHTVDDGIIRKVVGVYTIKDKLKTTFLRLDTDNKVYYKYEGKCMGKEYHNVEYSYWGSWEIDDSEEIRLKQDRNNGIIPLYILFPCSELIEMMQEYYSLVIYIKSGKVYGGRCKESLQATKLK